MEGISGALARIGELEGRLSTLRAPEPSGRFDALLRQAGTAPGPVTPAPSDVGPGAAWLSAQRPAALGGTLLGGTSLGAVVGGTLPPDALAGTTPAARAFPNGQLPAAALTSIGGDDRLTAPAAQGFLDMRAAAARDGVELPVNDSYRSLAEQEDMARRKGLYSEGGLAARPGTSTHGLGLSVDLQLDARALAWMRENGGRFGFVEDVPREPWHWTFKT